MSEDLPDIVYILGRGSKWRNNEIRFSLRSVERYLPHGRVFVVGECPQFLRNVIHIPAEDGYRNKLANAVFKIRTACREIELSERFILMNDDFFMMRHFEEAPNYNLGKLRTMAQEHSTKAGYYYDAIRRTLDLLQAAGISDPISYEVHSPMIIEKQKFLEITNAIEWEDTGYLFRSIYGNIHNVGGRKREDTKVHAIEDLPRLSKSDIISTADRVVLKPDFQRFIFNKFKNPSKYEDPETDPGKLP